MPTRAQLSAAWDAIRSFLGEPVAFHLPGQASAGPHDLELIDALARAHRLDTVLAEPRLTPHSPLPHVGEAIWRHWEAAHTAALAQAVHRYARLKELLAAVDPTPVIVTKGFAAAELLYPSPGARSMGDVDILVPAAELEPTLQRLSGLGYRRQYPGHPVLDAPEFHERQLIGPMDLDVHQAFIQPRRLPIDYRAIFERAIPWPALAPNARVLAPADAVAYAALHFSIGELTPEWSPAIGLWDLRQMLRRKGPLWGFGPSLDPGEVAARSREWHAERLVYVALVALQHLFPSTVASVALARPALSPALSRLLDAAIVRRALPPGLRSPRRPEVLMRKALLLRPRDRLRFGMREAGSRLSALLG